MTYVLLINVHIFKNWYHCPVMADDDPAPPPANEDQPNNRPPQISQWINTGQVTPTRDAVVMRVPRIIPTRSVSTYSFHEVREPQKVRAAPFPTIPTKVEVLAAKAETEQEIQRLRAELSLLQHERASFNRTAHAFNPEEAIAGVHEYRGLLITEKTVSSVIMENKSRKSDATEMWTLADQPSFRTVLELPGYRRTISSQRRNLVPLFHSQLTERVFVDEHARELALRYKEKRERWLEKVDMVTEYSAKTDMKSDVWPPEFTMDTPKIEDSARLKWVARDQPMYLSPRDRRSECYYDMNRFVEDPRREHDEYRARLHWSNDERQIFIEIYRKNPKNFRKIADALPEKTHKDVIEFYYLNRYALCLKENEGMARKRGGRKKVISEGSTKKNY